MTTPPAVSKTEEWNFSSPAKPLARRSTRPRETYVKQARTRPVCPRPQQRRQQVMRLFGIIGTAVLSSTLGGVAPLSAQHEKQDEKKDHSQERPAKHEQTKPAQQHAEHAQQQRQPEQKQEHAQHA